MVSPAGNAPFGNSSSILPSAVVILPPLEGMNLLTIGPVGVPAAVENGVTLLPLLLLLLLFGEALFFLQVILRKGLRKWQIDPEIFSCLKIYLKLPGQIMQVNITKVSSGGDDALCIYFLF